MFYRPLPDGKLTLRDLMRFSLRGRSRDIAIPESLHLAADHALNGRPPIIALRHDRTAERENKRQN